MTRTLDSFFTSRLTDFSKSEDKDRKLERKGGYTKTDKLVWGTA
jgi:hypothetical protein